MNADGTPKWRMAPGPTARTGSGACRTATRDVGSWTFFKDHDANKTAAAWLYAQFVTSKTVSAEEVGRRPDLHPRQRHPPQYFTDRGQNYGGLIEFYRSPARVAWTPTGTNVPDYPKLAQLWWKNVAVAVTGEDAAAGDGQPRRGDGPGDGPPRARQHGALRAKLNKKGDPEKWLSDKGRAVEEAGQREPGRDDRLRHAAQRLEERQGEE